MEPLDGERAESAVASTKKSWFTPGRNALLIGVAATAVIGVVFWKNPGQKHDEDAPKGAPPTMGQAVVYEPPKPVPMPPAPPVLPPEPRPYIPPQASLAPPPGVAQITPPAVLGVSNEKKAPRVLSYATEAPSGPAGGNGAHGAAAPSTGVTYKGAEIVGAKAGPAIDKSLVLMPGIIRCVLDTAIDSTLPGPLMCHLPAPVISDGNVVLMEMGTQIFGQYTSEVKQGQGRLMAVSATAYTPNGVPVPLGGPFADALGRTGLDGNVDNHWAARLGGSVMLSLADSALSIGQAAVSKGGNSYVSLSSGSGVSSLAQDLLRATINQPPTITKDVGAEVSIWVLTPIDFSSAYKLRAR